MVLSGAPNECLKCSSRSLTLAGLELQHFWALRPPQVRWAEHPEPASVSVHLSAPQQPLCVRSHRVLPCACPAWPLAKQLREILEQIPVPYTHMLLPLLLYPLLQISLLGSPKLWSLPPLFSETIAPLPWAVLGKMSPGKKPGWIWGSSGVSFLSRITDLCCLLFNAWKQLPHVFPRFIVVYSENISLTLVFPSKKHFIAFCICKCLVLNFSGL